MWVLAPVPVRFAHYTESHPRNRLFQVWSCTDLKLCCSWFICRNVEFFTRDGFLGNEKRVWKRLVHPCERKREGTVCDCFMGSSS